MTAILKSLETITTGYTSFEKDQVLTHEQLNTLSDYADDQVRLSRVKLVGVGIVAGLRVARGDAEVTLSPGVGVTTDGDLLHVDRTRRYDRFRAYDRQGPSYPPFERVVGETTERIRAFELVAVDVADAQAAPLAAFPGGVDALLRTTAVLFVASCVLDTDLCSGTTCDNMGQKVQHEQRLLLVDSADADRLRASVRVPDAAYAKLPELSVARPVPRPEWTRVTSLVEAFRAAARTAHDDLLAALDRLEQVGMPLPDTFAASPIGNWRERLVRILQQQESDPGGAQYHYDLLRDLVETWNAAREALFDDSEWLHDDIEQFPKHLLLGDLAAPDRNRTGFHPSPALRLHESTRRRHRALLHRFDRLLAAFDSGLARDRTVKVTPSARGDRPLEERAIPAYYRADAAFAAAWSHEHARRGRHDRLLGYHAANYSQRPEVLEPLGVQLGGHGFFRIEGHIGRPVADALRELQMLIRQWGLPFAVEAVLLASEGRVVVRPPVRFTDLDRLHAVLRLDLVKQLDDVVTFSGSLRADLQAAADAKRIDDASPGSGVALTQLAAQEAQKLVEARDSVRAQLAGDYAGYRAAPSWKENVRAALQSAARLKQDQSAVAKTNFATPVDTLISSTHLGWLEVLDDLRDQRDRGAEEKLRFGAFLAAYPGADHEAGVTAGGTFVLVYGSDGRVQADLMLPYRCGAPEADEEPTVRPPTSPPIRPEWITTQGLKILPQLDKEIGARLQQFEARFKPEIVERIELQADYFRLFQTASRGSAAPGGGAAVATNYLDLLAQEAAIKRAMLDLVKSDPNAGAERVSAAEAALAGSLESVVAHVAESGTAVQPGSAALRHIEEVAAHLQVLSAQRRAATSRAIAATPTTDASLRRVLETFRSN